MFKFVIALTACLACATAEPGVFAPTAFAAAPAAAVAYANAPLYAAGGSSQIDVRHNFDGTLSSYTTAPFSYTAPYSSRYVAAPAPAPVAFAAPAKVVAQTAFAAPHAHAFAAPAAFAAPTAFAAPAKFVAPAAHYASSYAAPHAHFTAKYASPYATYAAPHSHLIA
ncbi:uncharacterized protein LOC142233960 [Haematobia irritans]|uniref:uncharacterized protein LOC142233960 n=1 Tax=Haematobia irritans TaxID=7368 RepID=UPI003F4FFF66